MKTPKKAAPTKKTLCCGKPKSLFLIILLIIILGVVALTYSKGDALKGQLLGQNQDAPAVTEESTQQADLEADIVLVAPTQEGEDLKLQATVRNLGPGFIDGKTPFEYAIEVDGEEVFSNTDSYTSMGQGDSFSFEYTAPRALYEYSDKGKISFIVDTKDSIDEINEKNNEKEISYSY